ncbi:putative RNA-directed DNA polymerase from transposon X-element [Merluccius polli]|uniref:RNA-directed DNA polymerase from transposon X-element n=1 Tax=Merluccius polli TaxID=89951 RepID=A0AA47MPX3_MERPO|nr:putative RNA-directed DNA polymerase from transposon X-element [Merluccius polli]
MGTTEEEPVFHPDTAHFTQAEVEAVLRTLPNNKASGMDSVSYKDLKATQAAEITSIFNVCLENRRVPDSWKGALVHRIPKKDNIPDNPTTWRDISLLPSIYKVFMKCVLARILPWLVDVDILSPKQKAYINRQGMIEHVF